MSYVIKTAVTRTENLSRREVQDAGHNIAAVVTEEPSSSRHDAQQVTLYSVFLLMRSQLKFNNLKIFSEKFLMINRTIDH